MIHLTQAWSAAGSTRCFTSTTRRSERRAAFALGVLLRVFAVPRACTRSWRSRSRSLQPQPRRGAPRRLLEPAVDHRAATTRSRRCSGAAITRTRLPPGSASGSSTCSSSRFAAAMFWHELARLLRAASAGPILVGSMIGARSCWPRSPTRSRSPFVQRRRIRHARPHQQRLKIHRSEDAESRLHCRGRSAPGHVYNCRPMMIARSLLAEGARHGAAVGGVRRRSTRSTMLDSKYACCRWRSSAGFDPTAAPRPARAWRSTPPPIAKDW